jgi:alkylation response protein AidB-like acyl-CoA dehydrogenase
MDVTTALRDSVRTLLTRQADDTWPRLRGIGAPGLAIPECFGGAGASLRETCVVLEELGRTLTPSPLLGSAVLAAQALLATGDTDACRRLLPGIADGGLVAALVWTGPAGRWTPDGVACHADAAGALTGEAHHVLDGDVADVLLVAARTPDGVALFEVAPGLPGVSRTGVTAMDLTRRLAVVELAGAAGRRIGPVDLARVRDVACVALSAEQVGAAARALELTVGYAKTRVQFGRPIGAFQALQHRMADLHVLVEAARSASCSAVEALGSADLAVRAAVAKVRCSEALMRVAGEMIQIHGGIGITWEHDAHRYFKRAHGAWHLFGQPAEHVARLATLLFDVGRSDPIRGALDGTRSTNVD